MRRGGYLSWSIFAIRVSIPMVSYWAKVGDRVHALSMALCGWCYHVVSVGWAMVEGVIVRWMCGWGSHRV